MGRGFLFQVADSAGAGAATYDCELSWQDTTGKLSFEVTTTGAARQVIQAPSAYTDNAWHFVTAALTPSGMYLFVDGSQVQSGTGVNSNTARIYAGPTYLWIGAASTDGEQNNTTDLGGGNFRFFTGDIDEVLVSTVAMPLSQIQELYTLNNTRGVGLGSPAVELSTQSGSDFTWTRTSTVAFSITGVKGTNLQQLFTSSISLSAAALRQTASPGADTNQILFIVSSLDSKQTTAQFTILVDTTPPPAPAFTSLSDPTTFSLMVNGLSGSDALSGLPSTPFKVQASTDSGFGIINADSGFVAGPGFTFTTLDPNTTYYVRALARDMAGNISGVSSYMSTATLAAVVTGAQVYGVWTTSITVNWASLPVSPSSSTAEGYVLEVSTEPGFVTLWGSSATAGVALSTLTIANLTGGYTYYFRAASRNWNNIPNYAVAVSTQLEVVLSLSISPTTYAYGQIPLNTSTNSATNLTLTNEGNVDVNFSINATTITPDSQWQVWDSTETAPAYNKLLLRAVFHDIIPTLADYGDEDLVTEQIRVSQNITGGGRYTVNNVQTGIAVPAGEQRKIWFRLDMPTSSYSVKPQSLKFTIEAGQP